MPENYLIDVKQQVIWTCSWGVLSDADLLAQQVRLKADPQFESSFNQLIDTLEVTEVTLSGKMVQQVATHSLFSPESKRAFVVKKDVIYGLGRMFELYQSIKGGRNVRVFRCRKEAVAWLEVVDQPANTPDSDRKAI